MFKRSITTAVLSLFFLLFFLPKIAQADLVNPEYFSKKCQPTETEVTCSYRSTQPFGPTTFDSCNQYKNNPNYRFLVREGHSFGGSEKYCFKASSSLAQLKNFIAKVIPSVLLTLILELIVFILFGFRSKRALTSIFLANLISVSLFTLATIYLPFNSISALLTMEVMVVIFEILWLKLWLPDYSTKRIIFTTTIANIISAYLGYLLLIAIRVLLGADLSVIILTWLK